MSILRIITFIVFGSQYVVAQLSNTTFDNLMDGVVLRPLNAWHRATFVDGGTEKLIAFSDDPAATIVFTFPMRASAVYWRGFKLPKGANYLACLDCTLEDDNNRFTLVDGHDESSQPQTFLTTLLKRNNLSESMHTLIIKNIPDTRFGPENTSRISVESFILTNGISESTTPFLIPRESSLASNPSSTSIQSVTDSKVEATIIILIVVFTVLVLGIILGLFFWWRRRYAKLYERLNSLGESDLIPLRDNIKKEDPVYSPMVETLRDKVMNPENLPLIGKEEERGNYPIRNAAAELKFPRNNYSFGSTSAELKPPPPIMKDRFLKPITTSFATPASSRVSSPLSRSGTKRNQGIDAVTPTHSHIPRYFQTAIMSYMTDMVLASRMMPRSVPPKHRLNQEWISESSTAAFRRQVSTHSCSTIHTVESVYTIEAVEQDHNHGHTSAYFPTNTNVASMCNSASPRYLDIKNQSPTTSNMNPQVRLPPIDPFRTPPPSGAITSSFPSSGVEAPQDWPVWSTFKSIQDEKKPKIRAVSPAPSFAASLVDPKWEMKHNIPWTPRNEPEADRRLSTSGDPSGEKALDASHKILPVWLDVPKDTRMATKKGHRKSRSLGIARGIKSEMEEQSGASSSDGHRRTVSQSVTLTTDRILTKAKSSRTFL